MTSIKVTRVVTADTSYSVQLTLPAAQILAAFAPGLNAVQLASLAAAFRDTFVLTLNPAECDALAMDLYEAAVLPDQCEHDERFATTTLDGVRLCQPCAYRYAIKRRMSGSAAYRKQAEKFAQSCLTTYGVRIDIDHPDALTA